MHVATTLFFALLACTALVSTVSAFRVEDDVDGRAQLHPEVPGEPPGVGLAKYTLAAEPVPTQGRYAYVGIHYEGTARDEEYVLGLRVMIKSLMLSGTKHDIVIILSRNVSQRTRDLLAGDGAKLRIVDNIPNPFKASMEKRRTYKKRFEYTFNKLYLWDMVEYDRVVYLDSDNVALRKLDSLFLCGHFCAVFMNPVFFHTGLLVVKPDKERFTELTTNLADGNSYSYDGADQGFLVTQFPTATMAPLFRADQCNGVPSEATIMRVPLGYNMVHISYYSHMQRDFDQLRRDSRYTHFHGDTVKPPFGTCLCLFLCVLCVCVFLCALPTARVHMTALHSAYKWRTIVPHDCSRDVVQLCSLDSAHVNLTINMQLRTLQHACLSHRTGVQAVVLVGHRLPIADIRLTINMHLHTPFLTIATLAFPIGPTFKPWY
jgi:hypothetical protein